MFFSFKLNLSLSKSSSPKSKSALPKIPMLTTIILCSAIVSGILVYAVLDKNTAHEKPKAGIHFNAKLKIN
jgi:hypothetical protein